MSMKTGGGEDDPITDINVTPLVDVSLVLVIRRIRLLLPGSELVGDGKGCSFSAETWISGRVAVSAANALGANANTIQIVIRLNCMALLPLKKCHHCH